MPSASRTARVTTPTTRRDDEDEEEDLEVVAGPRGRASARSAAREGARRHRARVGAAFMLPRADVDGVARRAASGPGRDARDFSPLS
jgi:hypothetical protein|eukprot:31029-Pelagococcus_subviridis.AAC.16